MTFIMYFASYFTYAFLTSLCTTSVQNAEKERTQSPENQLVNAEGCGSWIQSAGGGFAYIHVRSGAEIRSWMERAKDNCIFCTKKHPVFLHRDF